MVLVMTRAGDPRSRLTAVLDALERELLAADSGEVRDAARETGRAWNVACQQTRVLLSDAIAASEYGVPVMPQPDNRAATGPYRH